MRKMKLLIMIMLCLTVSISGCGLTKTKQENDDKLNGNQKEDEVFKISEYDIEVKTSAGWTKMEETNFDLQCMSPSKDMIMSIFVYRDEDLKSDQTPEKLFREQTDELLSKRKNVLELEGFEVETAKNKVIYSMLCSADRDGGSGNYYQFYLIDFEGADTMAWILFTGLPTVVSNGEGEIDKIISNTKNLVAIPEVTTEAVEEKIE